MSAKLIVADAGPLIALAVGGVLPACVAMLGGMYVPEAVLQECIADPAAPGAAVIEKISARGDVQIVPQDILKPLDAAFAQGLGTGELAVLAYAATHGLLALVDERKARRVALHLKIAVIGSGTILAQLKRQGVISDIEPVFEAWQKHGYYVSDKLKRDIVLLSEKVGT